MAYEPRAKTHLDEISTRWPTVNDPLQFVMRYAAAVRSYLSALIDNPHDADDVCQDFLVNVLARGFAHVSPDRGRFRKYLKTAVRNAALMHFRHQRATRNVEARYLEQLDRADAADPAEGQWTTTWRAVLLERTWNALHGRQRRSGDNLFYTVLQAAADHPDEDSAALAVRVAKQTGNPLRADTFRQQLSRARRLFAELLLKEVAQTLEQPTPDAVREELAELGLLEYVHDV